MGQIEIYGGACPIASGVTSTNSKTLAESPLCYNELAERFTGFVQLTAIRLCLRPFVNRTSVRLPYENRV